MFSARAAGALRNFSFENLPEFRHAAYQHFKKTCIAETQVPRSLFAGDIDASIIECARANAQTAGVDEMIHFAAQDFFSAKPPAARGDTTLIALNPPYGERLGEEHAMLRLYARIGKHIQSVYPHAGYAVIVPGENFEKALGLEYDQKISFSNGGIRAAVLIKNGIV
jgi:putative N6-adenine-specific DNA methylase